MSATIHPRSKVATAVVTLLALVAIPTASTLARAESPEVEPDVATLLARHQAARGGAERWAKVESLSLTGVWEAFSMPGPFTVHRLAPDRWRFDHVLFGEPATLAYDGATAWIQGAALGVPEPARLDDPWKRNLLEDAPLRTPLLAGPSANTKIESLGRSDVDGSAAWALKVSREGFPDETWYLDAKTYLELKRESMTFDVFSGAIEIPMETYYDDFREVEGLLIPFHEERHFGTRYHVTDVESVVVNPELPASTFAAPPPAPEATEGEAAEDSSGGA
jgi:hypothetical protein